MGKISHGRPTENWSELVCEMGFSHLRVSTSLMNVELRIERPNFARSFVEEKTPPEAATLLLLTSNDAPTPELFPPG